ncbi:MAG: phosphonate ABC transporter, permease protein PhnE [Alphaproteobacteria bacterium]|nr:phosphonate ABC transporter, permease protein PhnE [Alphaproteobacteria bacterium]
MLSQKTEHDIDRERSRFPRVFSKGPGELAISYLLWGGTGLLTLYCLYRFNFFSYDFVFGLGKLGEIIVSQMFPPTGYEQLPTFGQAIAETLAMAFLGTMFGAIAALPLSFFASKNMMPIRPVQFGVRRFADLLRGFDYLIWALIFVRAIGLGPMSGIMAIAIVETGTFIKLYSETIENLDTKQIEGIRASGGNRLQIIRFGVMPQVLPVILSNTLYLFEHNTRSASILGIVGAGGVGFLLSDRLRAYAWQEACLIIILIVFTVYAIDYLSKIIRERFIYGDKHAVSGPILDKEEI